MYSGTIRDWPKRVHFGRGSIGRLPDILSALGRTKALVVCGRTVAGGVMLENVRRALGDRLVGVFDRISAHTPYSEVQEAFAMFQDLGADAVISVGGGSAIDAGKGIALCRATGGDFEPYRIDFGAKGSMERAAMPDPGIAHIAVPTTAGSSSDTMPTAGIRDPARGVKLLFWDQRLVPDATVLDPEMAVHAGPELTAATGMTAMARCVESLYSAHRQPFSTSLALHGARLLRRALPRAVEAPDDIDARADTQMGCLMSGVASINALASLVHAIGHGVGGRFGLQHGISHAILLAPAMRLLLPAIGEDQYAVLEAMGGTRDGRSPDEAGRAAADALQSMFEKLPLPRRLGAVGVESNHIPDLAAGTMGDYMMANLPSPLTKDDVAALLEEAL